MTLLILGGIRLERRISGFGGTTSWDWATLPTIEQLPVKQFVARAGDRRRLDVRVHPQLGERPSLTIARLTELGDAGGVVPLQLGTGRLLGYYVLTSFDESWQWTLPDGELLMADLALVLEPHRPPDAGPPAPLAVTGSTGPERTSPTPVDTDRDPSEVPLSEIVRA